MDLKQLINLEVNKGYLESDAEAKVCQDIILLAISKSSLSRNITIKGGVVTRSITNNIRRATQDMDIDFIKYPLTDEAIDRFIGTINCLDEIKINRSGKVENLNHQDYAGKSTKITVSDGIKSIEIKIDFGVHKNFNIKQEEYCFEISWDDNGALLLVNSKEQMFAEKLKSLLKFGTVNTRYKDIYDMFYYKDHINKDILIGCLKTYIFDDNNMRENTIFDIVNRTSSIFENKMYKDRVNKSDKRWLDTNIDEVFNSILNFLKGMI